MDLTQYEDLDGDVENNEEEEFASYNKEDQDNDGIDAIQERIAAIIQRSKERQANFSGKAQDFEEILAGVSAERKDHWQQIKNTIV
jgi:hypothetical protein